MQSSLFIN